jgi:flagellar biosynthetic protein FliQ
MLTSQQIIDLILKTLYLTIELSLPILGVALIVGLLVSVFQAATQINESTLSFLPKIAAIIFVIIALSPWMLTKMGDYTKKMYEKIPEIGRMK